MFLYVATFYWLKFSSSFVLQHCVYALVGFRHRNQTSWFGLKCRLWLTSSGLNSGVHRLFEAQGRKEGHFSACFGSQEGSLSCFNQPRGQFSVFCQPRGHFSMLFGSQEGTLVGVLAPKRALYWAFWLKRGQFSARFCHPRGQFIMF